MEVIPEFQLDITSSQESEAILLPEVGCTFKVDKVPRVAVIGGGPSGLCALRYLLENKLPAICFEQSDEIGGIWLYTDAVGKDKYGLPLQSALYKNLRTNLPKECMVFPDFPYKDQENSYINSEDVLSYLGDYADNFSLRPHIKLNHHVKRISPVGEGWSLTALDLPSNEEKVFYFEAIMICNGPHNIPVYPQIEGMAKFSGQQLHSREFRTVDNYHNKSLLVIGLGPSGMDISHLLSTVCKKVFLSNNKPKYEGSNFPENVFIKPTVESLNDKEVHFTDGTVEQVDVVIYCTGYTYNYPFLTEDCKIAVDQHVTPLYKHFINIEHPTMCIIGLPKYCPVMYLLDYQVRLFVKTLTGKIKLPSKEEMRADLEEDIKLRISEKQRKKDYHKLWREKTVKYFSDLSQLGDLEPIPLVQVKMFSNAFLRGIRNFDIFRGDKYKIIDSENFEVIEAV